MRRLLDRTEIVETLPGWFCWVTDLGVGPHGYASVRTGSVPGGDRRTERAHVFAYRELVGQVPDGEQLDHLCHTEAIRLGLCDGGRCVHRRCWCPEHLQPVPSGENARRGTGWAGRWRNTHCANGHEFTEANTYIRPNGTRCCRRCRADRMMANYYRKTGG